MTPLLELRGVSKHFIASRLWRIAGATVTKAVDLVSLSIAQGAVYGLVGESGSGKTTLGRLSLRLLEPSSGQILFEGEDIAHIPGHAMRAFRRRAQLIFQDPYSAFNPRRTIESSLSVPFEVHELAVGRSRRERIVAILERVGLGPEVLARYPHEFSGGQLQRLVLARALVVDPHFLVADEPVSSLDVSIQAQVLNLLRELQRQLGFTMLLISHDLRVIYHMSDRIGVMYHGKLVEEASKFDLYRQPLHPYTKALLRSAPTIGSVESNVSQLGGELWDRLPPANGCVFYYRCPIAASVCETSQPPLEVKAPAHSVACWNVPRS